MTYTDSKKRTINKIVRHDPSYKYLLSEPEKHSRYELHEIWNRIQRKERKAAAKKLEEKDG